MKNKFGVSLIILVITVVVLGILATAVVLKIKNTNIVDEAKSTVFKSDMTEYRDIWDMYIVKKTMQDITFDETNLNLTYKDAEFENVFGKIPDKYKDGLKVIKGKLVYITTDEEESEIIEDMGMIPNKMKIINRLVHCSTSDAATSVAYEKSYTSTLTVDAGYTLQKVTVVMGGTDITSSAYNSSSKTITIDKVTDNVVITATTDANTNTITNNLTQVVNSNEAVTAKTGTRYTAVLTEKTGYTLKTVKVTMAGTDVTSSVYDSSTNTITISSVTGDIIITASASAKLYTVAYDLTNVTTSNLRASATYGSKYTTTLAPKTDYEMKSVTVLVNNVDVTKSAYDSSTNTVTINSVVGDVLITAVAEIDPKAEVTIPAGFYYVGGTKDTGLVISDNSADENKGVDYTCVGNQFVWVPVDDYSKFVRGEAEETYEDSGIYKMTGTLSTYFGEPYTENDWEVAEYNAMCESVEEYGGFYIARFEAGDGDVTEERTEYTTAHTVVSKKGAIVYNYVSWGESKSSIGISGAVYLSQNMYKNSSSVVSTLCYGVQWDAVLNFVSDSEHDIVDSRSWGNYSDSTGEAATNSGTSNMNYITGRNEAWKAKNIYDFAGNVREWTMEMCDKFGRRVWRDSGKSCSGSMWPVSYRYLDYFYPAADASNYGFRPTLYIK